MEYLRIIRMQLEQDLERIKQEEHNILFNAKKALVIIRQNCRSLNIMRLKGDFATKEEEVYFFKELKCYFYSQLYFYQDVATVYGCMPNGGQESKLLFLKKNLKSLADHFSRHRQLYMYYRMEDTYKDEYFFSKVRMYDIKLDEDGKNIFCEDDFSCMYDCLYSKVISNDRLEIFLQKEIDILTYLNLPNVGVITKNSFEWTESKASLVELIYGLHESKCINDGKLELRQLAELLKNIFPNVDIRDYYRIFIDLKSRSQRTKFIDTMKSNLIYRLEQEDS
jgi:hypothetical protein